MKIITKDNFARDLYQEVVVARNVNEWYGKQMVKAWNDEHWDERSDSYLELVEDDYECYNGYNELM